MNKSREEVLAKLTSQVDVSYFLTTEEFKVLEDAMVTPKPIAVKKTVKKA
jgi:hypothetical protein